MIRRTYISVNWQKQRKSARSFAAVLRDLRIDAGAVTIARIHQNSEYRLMTATRVKFETTMGPITLELDDVKAPVTTANFTKYVEADFYAGTIFHRVIDQFMVQGGGLDADMNNKATRAPIKNEANNGLINETATVAMARTGDPHSATAQFFINVQDNHFLNHKNETPDGWGYCVFGRVVSGMDVVNAIKTVPTTSRGGMRDVPSEPIIITSAMVDRD